MKIVHAHWHTHNYAVTLHFMHISSE